MPPLLPIQTMTTCNSSLIYSRANQFKANVATYIFGNKTYFGERKSINRERDSNQKISSLTQHFFLLVYFFSNIIYFRAWTDLLISFSSLFIFVLVLFSVI